MTYCPSSFTRYDQIPSTLHGRPTALLLNSSQTLLTKSGPQEIVPVSVLAVSGSVLSAGQRCRVGHMLPSCRLHESHGS
eukprot:scaffold7457_cov390-Prasinococcus_capsulatus_cf.AAC.1